jgi:hypothetical protein
MWEHIEPPPSPRQVGTFLGIPIMVRDDLPAGVAMAIQAPDGEWLLVRFNLDGSAEVVREVDVALP